MALVYLKGQSEITDMLSIFGAQSARFAMEDAYIRKELRNNANRAVNCDSANVQRAVTAASRQTEAIERVLAAKGRESLPPALRETAALRLAAPGDVAGGAGQAVRSAGGQERYQPPAAQAGDHGRRSWTDRRRRRTPGKEKPMELTIKIAIPKEMMTRQAADIAQRMSGFESRVLLKRQNMTVQRQIADGRAFRRTARRAGRHHSGRRGRDEAQGRLHAEPKCSGA